MVVVYKITYPNGKIYIGQDRTDDINYFGSASTELIEKDFTEEERISFTITRDSLWKSASASGAEINDKEKEFILLHHSNDPSVGYNKLPVFQKKAKPYSIT